MIPEALARALAAVPAELVGDLIVLVKRVLASPNPKDTLARAIQVTTHEKLADSAIDAALAAKSEVKKHVPGTGE